MDDLSNRTLAIILITAILISFGGTLFGMTRLTAITGVKVPKVFVPLINAMATATATVNLSVYELTELNWTPAGLNWSQGRVDDGKMGCTITSDGNDGSITLRGVTNNCTVDPFGTVSNGINLTNIGNTNITVNISTSTNAAGFIGGTGVSAKWNVSDAWGIGATTIQDVCVTTRPSSWTAFSTTQTIICLYTNDTLRTTPGNNTLRFDFEFVIPYDVPAGSKNATVTATYAKASG